VLALIPVPGVGAGVLTPAGNLASFIRPGLLGRHLLDPRFDPEGLLSTLPALATALSGVFAGDWLKETGQPHRAGWLWAVGFAAMLAGSRMVALSFRSTRTSGPAPLRWSAPGIAAQVLAAFYWLVEVQGWREWSRPLVVYGRNPLAAYFLSVGCDSLLTHWTVCRGGATQVGAVSHRLRIMAASVLRRRGRVARLRARLRCPVGRDSRRDVPAAYLHWHLREKP